MDDGIQPNGKNKQGYQPGGAAMVILNRTAHQAT